MVTIFLTSSIISCTKDDADPPPVIKEANLSYAEGGAGFSSVTNPSANASTNEIFGQNGTTNVVEIKVASLVVGVYDLGTINQFKYTRPGTSSL